MYMAHPAIISCLGTSTKEENLLIMARKKKEVLIVCSHSESLSPNTAFLQLFPPQDSQDIYL